MVQCLIQGGSKTLICLTLQKPEISASFMGHFIQIMSWQWTLIVCDCIQPLGDGILPHTSKCQLFQITLKLIFLEPVSFSATNGF